MSEKITDYLMLSTYKKIFGRNYHTEGNKEYFGKLLPDGWDTFTFKGHKILFIIENKKEATQTTAKQAKEQLLNYYKNIPENIKKEYLTWFIVGLGNTENNFKYYILNSRGTLTKHSLEEFKENNTTKITLGEVEKEIHEVNQIIYN